MKTIADLKLTLNQLNWICEKTDDYKDKKFARGFLYLINNDLFTNYKNDTNKRIDKNLTESFIYQAIDGVNCNGNFYILQNSYCVVVFQSSVSKIILKKNNERFVFKMLSEIENDVEEIYADETTARLAALQWIAIQEGVE